MSTLSSPSYKRYYEKYWANGQLGYSGDSQGYAANLRRWMHRLLKDIPRETRLLEVGCGDGAFTRDLATHSARVTAVDIAAQQLERNAAAHPDICWVQHDVADPLPFGDGVFEVIWCSEVLEHLFDPAFALREMHRVLSRGGLLAVTVPYHGPLKNVLIALFKWDEHFRPNHPHIRFFSRKTLTQVVADAGFVDIRTQTCGMNKPLRDQIVPTNILLTASKTGGN